MSHVFGTVENISVLGENDDFPHFLCVMSPNMPSSSGSIYMEFYCKGLNSLTVKGLRLIYVQIYPISPEIYTFTLRLVGRDQRSYCGMSDSVDQNQTAHNVQSDHGPTLSDKEIILLKK